MPRSHPYPIQVQGRSTEEIKAAELRKQEEEKKLKKAAAPKQKKYYDVRLEALVPCTITYRVYADDEHDALNEMKKKSPMSVKPNVSQKRDIKAAIYDAGSSILRFSKTFRF